MLIKTIPLFSFKDLCSQDDNGNNYLAEIFHTTAYTQLTKYETKMNYETDTSDEKDIIIQYLSILIN